MSTHALRLVRDAIPAETQVPLSALNRDVRGLGMLVGTALLSATTLKEQVCVRGTQQVIVVRGSTAPTHETHLEENNGSVRHP